MATLTVVIVLTTLAVILIILLTGYILVLLIDYTISLVGFLVNNLSILYTKVKIVFNHKTTTKG